MECVGPTHWSQFISTMATTTSKSKTKKKKKKKKKKKTDVETLLHVMLQANMLPRNDDALSTAQLEFLQPTCVKTVG